MKINLIISVFRKNYFDIKFEKKKSSKDQIGYIFILRTFLIIFVIE